MLMVNLSRRALLAGVATMLAITGAASAASVSFNFAGSHASGLKSAAIFTFDNTANTVVIKLSNTTPSPGDSLASRWLTGLFWDMNTPTMTKAMYSSGSFGSTVNPTAPGSDPDHWWAYQSNSFAGQSGSAPGGVKYGLGAAGFDLFPPSSMFTPRTGQPDGVDGGVLSPTGNPQNAATFMYRSFVQFTFDVPASFFSGFAPNLSDLSVTKVAFQHGSDLNEPSYPGTPETLIPLPSAAGLALAGLLAVGARRRRAL